MGPRVFTFYGCDVIITPIVPKCWQFWKAVKFQVEYDQAELDKAGVNPAEFNEAIKKFIEEI